MASFKDHPGWLVFSLLFLAVVGTGGAWQFRSDQINRMKASAELRDREIVIYRDALSVADKISEIYAKHPTASHEEIVRLRSLLDIQMKMRVADFTAVERDLASLENREPQEMPVVFLQLAPPTNFRATVTTTP